MCFLTCWLVIPLGEPVRFTSWGILSGLFGVPGGCAGVYAIRNAGLAVSAGTWSSLIVLRYVRARCKMAMILSYPIQF